MINFLKYDRNKRQETCEEGFTNPEAAADIELLEKTISLLNRDPQDKAEQARLLKDIYQVWNNCLIALEDSKWRDQAPPQWDLCPSLPTNAIVAVVGGKHSNSFRGTGDWVVDLLLGGNLKSLLSHSRSAADDLPEGCSCEYTHHTQLEGLIEDVVSRKASDKDAPVLFIYTIGFTGSNGDVEKANNDSMQKFCEDLAKAGLLDHESVKVCLTSTFHASPKEAYHEDNLADNYGLADYGASKVMQTLQLAEAIYSKDPKVRDSGEFEQLQQLKRSLEQPLKRARDYWVHNPECAMARACPEDFFEIYRDLIMSVSNVASELNEDTQGAQSVLLKLMKLSPRFNVVKVPYMLSNTAVYKRFFVFVDKIRSGKSVWEFFKACSFKRFRIIMSPKRAAIWHLAVAEELLQTEPLCLHSRRKVFVDQESG